MRFSNYSVIGVPVYGSADGDTIYRNIHIEIDFFPIIWDLQFILIRLAELINPKVKFR